ncbi:MAG: DUF4288 domain-containing protein, partial [Thermoanaerobaculia bacterium]
MWYSASLLFRAVHPTDRDSDWLWQDRIVLMNVSDEDMAQQRGEALGREYEHEYQTSSGTVRWEFVRVERLCQIEGELRDGAELFSRFLRESEAKSLLKP